MLAHCELFKGLDYKHIENFLSLVPSSIKEYAEGEYIWTPFRFNSQLGIVLEGDVIVYKSLCCGNEFTINRLDAGNLIGLSCVWGNYDLFPAYVEAKSKCKILFLPQESLIKLFELNSQIFNNFMNYVDKRLHYLINKVELLAISNTKEKVLFYLCQQAKIHGGLIKINKSQLLNQLAISHASLYRALEQLEQDHYIKRHPDGSITLCVAC
ncbi:MAG: Crp/Fnr family transcriptional regulator [Tissierellia bacterium]|nr:Crp/Fnr family transcriptional regulator [Tissierellia bacterium]